MFEFVTYWLRGLLETAAIGSYWVALLHIISYARVGQILITFVIPVLVGALAICAANGGGVRTKRLWSMCGLFMLPLPLFVAITSSGVNVFLMRSGQRYTNTTWHEIQSKSPHAKKEQHAPICARNQGADPNRAYPIDSYYFEGGFVDTHRTVDVALCESEVGSCELWVIAPVYAHNNKHHHHHQHGAFKTNDDDSGRHNIVAWALGVGSGVFHNLELPIYESHHSAVAVNEFSLLAKHDGVENKLEVNPLTGRRLPAAAVDLAKGVSDFASNTTSASDHLHQSAAGSATAAAHDGSTKIDPEDLGSVKVEDDEPHKHGHNNSHNSSDRKISADSGAKADENHRGAGRSISSPHTAAVHAPQSPKSQSPNKNPVAAASQPQKQIVGFRPIPPSMRCDGGDASGLCGVPVCGRKVELLQREWFNTHGGFADDDSNSELQLLDASIPAFFFIDPDVLYATHIWLLSTSLILLLLIMVIAVGIELCPRRNSRTTTTTIPQLSAEAAAANPAVSLPGRMMIHTTIFSRVKDLFFPSERADGGGGDDHGKNDTDGNNIDGSAAVVAETPPVTPVPRYADSVASSTSSDEGILQQTRKRLASSVGGRMRFVQQRMSVSSASVPSLQSLTTPLLQRVQSSLSGTASASARVNNNVGRSGSVPHVPSGSFATHSTPQRTPRTPQLDTHHESDVSVSRSTSSAGDPAWPHTV